MTAEEDGPGELKLQECLLSVCNRVKQPVSVLTPADGGKTVVVR